MAAAGNKTVRFTQVVERSGTPHVHTLWLQPEDDPELRRAQKNDRVMTIASAASGSKADVGVVGFDTGTPGSQFLIFPKSLKRFAGRRVVGVKFDLVEQPKLASAAALTSAALAGSGRRKAKRKHAARHDASAAVLAATPESPSPVTENEPEREPDRPSRETPGRHEKAETEEEAVIPFRTPQTGAGSRARERAPSPRAAAADKSSDAAGSVDHRALVREVKLAMKELERGKSVAAYQRLQRAIADE